MEMNQYGLTELNSAELLQLQGDADGNSSGIWAGEDGLGCTRHKLFPTEVTF